ncbi:MAG TPA: hypothetical protein VIX73_23065, partial [Kofleriaceae bacterium]
YAATAHPSASPGYPASTTRGGAAGQIVSTAPTAASPRRSRAPLVVGGLLVALVGGAAVVITRGNDDPSATTLSSTGATARDSTSPSVATHDSTSPTGSAAHDSTSPNGSAAHDSTSPGGTARDSTSSGKHTARDAASDKRAGSATSRVNVAGDAASQRSSTAMIATSAPSFRLDAKVYAPGEEIGIRFAGPVSSKPQSRAWITVIAADQPASSYGDWSYLDDGATTASLKAPARPGPYEIRLHTDYPAKSFNVQHTVALTVGPEAPAPQVTPLSAQRFTVAAPTLSPGAKIHIAFATALHAAPKEQFWITIVDAGAADNTWGVYEYVPPDARHMQLTAPAKPGDYEVRLHANYPTKTTNLVHRVAIHVE